MRIWYEAGTKYCSNTEDQLRISIMKIQILPLLAVLIATTTTTSSLPTTSDPSRPVRTEEQSANKSTDESTSLSSEEPSTTPITTTTNTVDTSETFEIMNNTACDSYPCIEIDIIQDDLKLMNLEADKNERFADHEVKWFVLAKTTHIDKEEESVYDYKTGKTQRKVLENRYEQLKVLRDNRYGSLDNEFNFVKAFQA